MNWLSNLILLFVLFCFVFFVFFLASGTNIYVWRLYLECVISSCFSVDVIVSNGKSYDAEVSERSTSSTFNTGVRAFHIGLMTKNTFLMFLHRAWNCSSCSSKPSMCVRTVFRSDRGLHLSKALNLSISLALFVSFFCLFVVLTRGCSFTLCWNKNDTCSSWTQRIHLNQISFLC